MPGCPGLRPHSDYYIITADLHFRVDNTLFKIHSHFFERESCKWRKILNVPLVEGQSRDGACDQHPIVITKFSASDFAQFLWVFYNPKFSIYEAAPSEWETILKIADEYDFPEVKDLAIRSLNDVEMSIAKRIKLYQLYNAPHRSLVPLLMRLCKRSETLSEEELECLGMKTSLVVFRARERLRSHPASDGKIPLPKGVEDAFVKQTLCTLLGNSTAGGSVAARTSTVSTTTMRTTRRTVGSLRRGYTDADFARRDVFVYGDQVFVNGSGYGKGEDQQRTRIVSKSEENTIAPAVFRDKVQVPHEAVKEVEVPKPELGVLFHDNGTGDARGFSFLVVYVSPSPRTLLLFTATSWTFALLHVFHHAYLRHVL